MKTISTAFLAGLGFLLCGLSYAAVSPGNTPRAAAAVVQDTSLWLPGPTGIPEVPYSANGSQEFEQAVATFNRVFTGVIQWVPRTTQASYVDVKLPATGFCSAASFVGRKGGVQEIEGTTGPDCQGNILHEMGHAVGLIHEHQRPDRDSFIKVNWWAIDPGSRASNTRTVDGKGLGFYDISSIVHHAIGGSRGDLDARESVPAGIPIFILGTYSPGDIDGIRRMYGVAPSQVTIVTNPPGLQVSVDGTVVAGGTPQAVFNWALNSDHILDVPENLRVQTYQGNQYAFARWNDSPDPAAPARHTINVAPGDGSAMSPVEKPRNTVHMANFRLMRPAADLIAITADPADAGRG